MNQWEDGGICRFTGRSITPTPQANLAEHGRNYLRCLIGNAGIRIGLEFDVRWQVLPPGRLDMIERPFDTDSPQFSQLCLEVLFQIKNGLWANRLATNLLQQLPQTL